MSFTERARTSHPKEREFFMLHFMTSVSAFQDVAMYSYNLPNLTGLRDLRALPMSELHWLTPWVKNVCNPVLIKRRATYRATRLMIQSAIIRLLSAPD
jgi:hypothetical protein